MNPILKSLVTSMLVLFASLIVIYTLAYIASYKFCTMCHTTSEEIQP